MEIKKAWNTFKKNAIKEGSANKDVKKFNELEENSVTVEQRKNPTWVWMNGEE